MRLLVSSFYGVSMPALVNDGRQRVKQAILSGTVTDQKEVGFLPA